MGFFSFIGNAIKKITGIQAYQDKKEAERLHRHSERTIEETNRLNEEKKKELNDALEEFGNVRTQAVNEVVRPFRIFLEFLGKNNKEKSYETLVPADFNVPNISKLKELESGTANALRTLATSGGFAGVALMGTPALITSAVGALGTASTGAAIGSLHGAALTNATLAWLGGGSLAAGGGGVAAGSAALATATYCTAGIFAVAAAGLMFSAHYSKRLTQATEEAAKVEKMAAEARSNWKIIDAIIRRTQELESLTLRIKEKTLFQFELLEPLVYDFEVDNAYYVRQFQISALLVKSMTELAETPLIEEDGSLSPATERIQEKLENVLNDNS